jgi:hypothetical protein
MRKFIDTHSSSFPEPVHEGKPSLWHLTDILEWFNTNEAKKVSKEIFEVSQVNMELNILKSCIKVTGTEAENGPNNNMQPTPAAARLFVQSLRSFLHKNSLRSTNG